MASARSWTVGTNLGGQGVNTGLHDIWNLAWNLDLFLRGHGNQRLSELGVAYPGSPIVEGPGKRYFENSMQGGNSIRSRFLLLVVDGITLVRPKGYISYASPSHGGAQALSWVRSVLARQTDPSSSREIGVGGSEKR